MGKEEEQGWQHPLPCSSPAAPTPAASWGPGWAGRLGDELVSNLTTPKRL